MFCDLLQNKHRIFLLLYILCAIHHSFNKMLLFAFQSEIWIAENFNFSVFEVYRCHGNIDFHKM